MVQLEEIKKSLTETTMTTKPLLKQQIYQLIDQLSTNHLTNLLGYLQQLVSTNKSVLKNNTPSPSQPTLPRALGLLATNNPPSDTVVNQWLQERRLERYS